VTTYLERELGRGADLLSGAHSRAAALARAHAACGVVSSPVNIRQRPDGVVAFDVQVAAGASLAESGQGALTVGQCVTVGVAVAQGLAAMHAERIAHGDVSAANVVVKGRMVALVDTMGALAAERGTPGFAAPERSEGPSPAGDVYSLGMLLRSLAKPDALPVIEAWTAPLIATDPEDRPSAAHAARAIARCAPSEPLPTAASPVAAAMRAGALPRTQARSADRWWRAERMALRLSPLAALGVAALVAGWGLGPAVAGTAGGPAPRGPVPVSSVTLEGPGAAAVALTERRVTALARGDATRLADVTRAGSEARAGTPADVDELTGLELYSVASAVAHTSPGRAIVDVTSELSAYSVGHKDYPATTVRARLELTLTPQGWLVERVLPAP
jgi:hypothetical protein